MRRNNRVLSTKLNECKYYEYATWLNIRCSETNPLLKLQRMLPNVFEILCQHRWQCTCITRSPCRYLSNFSITQIADKLQSSLLISEAHRELLLLLLLDCRFIQDVIEIICSETIVRGAQVKICTSKTSTYARTHARAPRNIEV